MLLIYGGVINRVKNYVGKNLRWRVGNGITIKIYKDQWLPYNDYFFAPKLAIIFNVDV